MICPNCEKRYNEKMNFCISCGVRLVAEQDSDADSTIPETESLASDTPEYEYTGFIHEIAECTVHDEPNLKSENKTIPIPVKEKKSGFSFLNLTRFTVSLIISVIMLTLILAATSSAALRMVTAEKYIDDFIENLDIMKLPAFQVGLTRQANSIDETATVQEAIYAMSRGTGLSPDDIETIYDESTIPDFITEHLEEYADFIRSGNTPDKITSEDLKKVFDDNLELINSSMKKPLSQNDINIVFSEIDRISHTLEEISVSSLENSLGEKTFTALRLFSSVPVIVGIATLAAAMIPLLGVINRKGRRVLLWSGATVLAGGFSILAATFLFSMQIPFSVQDKMIRSIAKCAADTIAPDLYCIGTVLAALGIIMLICAKILKRHDRKAV